MPSWISSLPHNAGGLLLARADVESSFTEVMVWGIFILGLVVVLLILSRFIKGSVERSARSQEIPFGMTTADVDKLRDDAGVTPEEMKAIRQAMARRIRERAELEMRAKAQGLKPEVLLVRLEEEVRVKGAARVREQLGETPPVEIPNYTPPKPRGASLPKHLLPLLGKSDLELEDLQNAGFLSADDARLIREERGSAP